MVGVGVEVWVGVCVECLGELFVVLLVVLKVGGVFVLFDLCYLVVCFDWIV